MEDHDIVQLFFDRAEHAIEQTQQQYGSYCLSIALRMLNNDDDAAECVNDVWLKAWNSIPPERPSCLRTYLGKLTRRLAVDRYRRQTAQKRGTGEMTAVLDELAECLPDKQSTTEDRVEWKDTLERFLDTLEPTERMRFLRRYWYACSVKEIAQGMNMTETHVKVALHRTRLKMKAFLEKEGIDI